MKTLYIPESIASIIVTVYIEKNKKLSDIKKEDHVGYLTFRKFMIDLKKKTKKDPVAQAKVEVSKVCNVFDHFCYVFDHFCCVFDHFCYTFGHLYA